MFKDCTNLDYLFKFNNNCYKKCPDYSYSDNNNFCICEHKYYINNSLIYCLDKNDKCPEKFPLLNEKECSFKCPDNYLIFNNECLIECPQKFFKLNMTCIEKCPINYYKTKKKECVISDCIERDIDENILYIHENEYEEFMGNNSCDINLKKYKDFNVQIYNSNYIPQENNHSKLNISECENILKEKYNISINENLTIFKIDYFYENFTIPIIYYKLYYKDILLNLSYCGNNLPIINLDYYNISLNDSNFIEILLKLTEFAKIISSKEFTLEVTDTKEKKM
jgi:hypothetical protein